MTPWPHQYLSFSFNFCSWSRLTFFPRTCRWWGPFCRDNTRRTLNTTSMSCATLPSRLKHWFLGSCFCWLLATKWPVTDQEKQVKGCITFGHDLAMDRHYCAFYDDLWLYFLRQEERQEVLRRTDALAEKYVDSWHLIEGVEVITFIL